MASPKGNSPKWEENKPCDEEHNCKDDEENAASIFPACIVEHLCRLKAQTELLEGIAIHFKNFR